MQQEKDFMTNEAPEVVENVNPEAVNDAQESVGGDDEHIYHLCTQEQNPQIEELIKALEQHEQENDCVQDPEVVEALRYAMLSNCVFVVPVEFDVQRKEDADEQDDDENDVDIKFIMRTLEYQDGRRCYAVFTSLDEANQSEGIRSCTATMSIQAVLEKVVHDDEIYTMVINPFTKPYFMMAEQISDMFVDMVEEDPLGKICFYEKQLHETDADGAFEPTNGSAYEIEADEVIGVDNPVYSSRRGDYKRLYECYWDILDQAQEHGFVEIAVPNMGIIGGYPEDKARGIAIKAIREWFDVHPFPQLRVMLICGTKKRSKEYNDSWSRFSAKDRTNISADIDEEVLYEGLQYAMELYKDKVQPNGQPYLLHALEQMNIVRGFNFGTDMLLAALLHDALENGDTDVNTLVDRFGLQVAVIANSQGREESLPWITYQTQHIMNMGCTEDGRIKLLAFAKAITELRDIYAQWKEDPEFWQRMYAPRVMQGSYYRLLLGQFKEFELTDITEHLYQEYVDLYKKLFVI